MILSNNDVPIAAGGYSSGYLVTPDFPIERVSIFVFGNDVMMQVTESDQHPPAFSNPQETELHLYRGFQTLEPLVPWTGLRFRALKGPATISFRAYASV